MTKMADLQTPFMPNWCPGCGNMPLWLAFKNAAVKQDWNNSNTAVVAGIGCHGHLVNFTKLTAFEGLHGRALPAATGMKIANTSLNVFVFTGDGDCFGEGGNHFIHACRRNHNLTVVLHDNGLYALTTGQTSPITPHDSKTKSTPFGNPDEPFNPLVMAIASGATFVARAYASNMAQLTEMMIKANQHNGFAFIDVLQPCETFNKQFTHTFFQENTYYLEESYDPTNREVALARAREFDLKKIPLGVFFEEKKPSYEDQLGYLNGEMLYKHGTAKRDMSGLFAKYI